MSYKVVKVYSMCLCSKLIVCDSIMRDYSLMLAIFVAVKNTSFEIQSRQTTLGAIANYFCKLPAFMIVYDVFIRKFSLCQLYFFFSLLLSLSL